MLATIESEDYLASELLQNLHHSLQCGSLNPHLTMKKIVSRLLCSLYASGQTSVGDATQELAEQNLQLSRLRIENLVKEEYIKKRLYDALLVFQELGLVEERYYEARSPKPDQLSPADAMYNKVYQLTRKETEVAHRFAVLVEHQRTIMTKQAVIQRKAAQIEDLKKGLLALVLQRENRISAEIWAADRQRRENALAQKQEERPANDDPKPDGWLAQVLRLKKPKHVCGSRFFVCLGGPNRTARMRRSPDAKRLIIQSLEEL